MKFTFKPSPNYRNELSTVSIMKDLTLCLLAVLLYAVIYYSAAYGAQYGLRVVLLACDAVVASLATDWVFFKVSKKEDIKKEIRSSFSWVTALILVLISRIDTAYYAMAIATIIAVFFGKLVFGGFGQNIFNPAAFGEAIIMSNFAASYNTDFTTGATPTTAANSLGWMIPRSEFATFIAKFGGLGKMFLGQYPSTIGSTCALLILVCAIYLIWRRDIDWQAPVFYICTVFVEALIIGLMHGAGVEYALFSVLAGGVLFGGVFMVTDPVTTPVTIPGRIVYAVGAASLTLILRDKSNLADGVLYAILLMNMLSPAIDKMFDGNQIKDAAKFRRNTLIAVCASFVAALLVGTTVKPKSQETPAASGSTSAPASAPAASASVSYGDALAMSYNFNANKAECALDHTDGSLASYACSAKGFGLVTNADGDYSRNEAIVTVDTDSLTVKSVELTSFGDTAGVGDQATSEAALAQFEGKDLEDDVNLVSGATFTTRSIASMVQAALTAAQSGETVAAAPSVSSDVNYGDALSMSYNFNANKAECTLDGEDGSLARYACTAKGFGLVTNADGDYSNNEAYVTVDKDTLTITGIELTNFGDTAGVGDQATSASALAQFEGKGLEDDVNLVSGATFTTRSVAAMAQAALQAAGED